MERKVKYRSVFFYVARTDPVTEQTANYERVAMHGQTLSTEQGTDDGTTIYNVPEKEILRLEQTVPGVFFTDIEMQLAQEGVTDDLTERLGTDVRLGDAVSSPGGSQTAQESAVTPRGGGGWHPLALEELSEWQLAEYLRSEAGKQADLSGIFESVPEASRSAFAAKLMAAAIEVAGSQEAAAEEHEEFFEQAAALSGAQPTGPEGSDGVPGTLPDDADEVEGGSDAGAPPSGSYPPAPDPDGTGEDVPPTPDPTDQEVVASEAAIAAAAENGVDLREVTGTGSGGRITQPDVAKYVAERQ